MKEKGLYLFLGLILAQSAQPEGMSTIPCESVAAGEKSCVITVQNGLLTVKVRGIPLSQVLLQIAARARFDVVIKGAIEELVTDEFSVLPVEEGIRRLVRGKDFIFVYTPEVYTPEKVVEEMRLRLQEVRIFGIGAGTREDNSANARIQASSPATAHRSVAKQKRRSVPASVREALQSEDPKIRLAAVETLTKIEGKEAAEALIAALSDGNAEVRSRVTEALLYIGDERAFDPLTRVLLTDEDLEVRSLAAEALLDIGDERAIEPLATALKQDDVTFRARIVDTLGDAGSEKSIGLVAFALTDADQGVRMSAVDALERITLESIGGKEAMELLERAALEDRDEDVRERALAALSDLREEAVLVR